MLLRFVERLMAKFGRRNGTQLGRDAATGRFVVRDSGKPKEKRTYVNQETLRRSVVKLAREHRPALEWLADK